MQFPIIEFPWLGSGTVIAIIAVTHVLVNHAVAIGGSLLMVGLEYRGWKMNRPDLDQVARKMSKWILIITTTVGALTGVGIWFSTMVIQPNAIGSLLRVFFWAWFTEWIVFVAEVILILTYFFTWDKWTGKKKLRHIRTGMALSFASWLTMTIITAVLAAQLTPGQWIETRSFWDAVANPTWLPSLFFRTFVAIALAVAVFSPFIRWFVKNEETRATILSDFGKWMMVSIPFMLAFGMWYVSNLPEKALELIVWASGLQGKEMVFRLLHFFAILIMFFLGFRLITNPKRVSLVLSAFVAFLSIGLIGEFEMIRETIRKPYVIYDYMYVNGIRVDEVEKFNKEGFLPNSKWMAVDEVNEDNVVEAGREIFKGQCLACHTVDGWRSKRALGERIEGMTAEGLDNYIKNLHTARYFMPPFAGTDEERRALALYLEKAVNSPEQLDGMAGESK
ncbi:MAG: c-type cytochrome [Bacillaceae bacterium]|nr:c-type cytochrome [Bacillaceae bacterium]